MFENLFAIKIRAESHQSLAEAELLLDLHLPPPPPPRRLPGGSVVFLLSRQLRSFICLYGILTGYDTVVRRVTARNGEEEYKYGPDHKATH